MPRKAYLEPNVAQISIVTPSVKRKKSSKVSETESRNADFLLSISAKTTTSATQTDYRESETQTDPCSLHVKDHSPQQLASALLRGERALPQPDEVALDLLTAARGELPVAREETLRSAQRLISDKRAGETDLLRASAANDSTALKAAAARIAEGRARAEDELHRDWARRLRHERLQRLEMALDEFTAESQAAGRLRAAALRRRSVRQAASGVKSAAREAKRMEAALLFHHQRKERYLAAAVGYKSSRHSKLLSGRPLPRRAHPSPLDGGALWRVGRGGSEGVSSNEPELIMTGRSVADVDRMHSKRSSVDPSADDFADLMSRFDRLDAKLAGEMTSVRKRADRMSRRAGEARNEKTFLRRNERYANMLEQIGRAIEGGKAEAEAEKRKEKFFPLSSDDDNEVLICAPSDLDGLRDLDGFVGSVIAKAAHQVRLRAGRGDI